MRLFSRAGRSLLAFFSVFLHSLPLQREEKGSIMLSLHCESDKANPLRGCESRFLEVTIMVKAIVGANWGDEGKGILFTLFFS